MYLLREYAFYVDISNLCSPCSMNRARRVLCSRCSCNRTPIEHDSVIPVRKDRLTTFLLLGNSPAIYYWTWCYYVCYLHGTSSIRLSASTRATRVSNSSRVASEISKLFEYAKTTRELSRYPNCAQITDISPV